MSVVCSMRPDTLLLFTLLVPLLADTKLPLRDLAAVAQCEAICISDKEEWNKRSEEPEGRNAPQCLEEIDVSVVRTTCDKFCTDNEGCLQSCKCVHRILESSDRGSHIPKSAVEGLGLTQPELFCREADILNFKWTAPEGLHPVFVTEYREHGHNSWKTYNKTKSDMELISGLRSNTKYQIRVRALIRDGQLGSAVISHWTTTLNDTFIPEIVEDVAVNHTRGVNGTVNTIVSWTPSWDRTCFYELVFWNCDMGSPISQIFLREKLQFELKKLEFAKNYFVAVRSLSHDHMRESNKKDLDFTTPTCLEMLADHANCPPPMPRGLNIRQEVSSTPGLYNIKVMWSATDPSPGYQLVSLTSTVPSPGEEGGFVLHHNVSGDTTQTMFPGIHTVYSYRVSIVAVSANGYKSKPAVGYRKLINMRVAQVKKSEERNTNGFTLVMSLSLILAGLAVGIVAGVGCHRLAKCRQQRRQQLHLKQGTTCI